MDDNPEDCPVCLTPFDDVDHRPRNLPCGHTICTPCINGLVQQSQIICPNCRVEHAVPEDGQFPVSYAVEAFIKRLRNAASTSPPANAGEDTGEQAPSSPRRPGQKRAVDLSSAVRSLLQEQEAKVLAAIRTCQEVQSQLGQYQTTLAGWGGQQQHLENRLQTLVDQSKNARVIVQQEEFQVADKEEQVQQGEQQLHTMLQALRAVTTEQEVGVVTIDVARCTDEEKQRAEECQGVFPDAHVISTIRKVRAASTAALEAATPVQAAHETADAPAAAVTGNTGLPISTASSIKDRLEALLTPTLKVEDLRSLTQHASSMLQSGLVFAVHQVDGKSLHGRISLENGRLYLHFLQKQPVPLGASIVQVDEVVPTVPPCLVFLDLAWPGSMPRRVLIRLNPDTSHGRQFVLLCTGQLGPCYANTRLYDIQRKDQAGEYVCGGDYERNDGNGGSSVLPDLDDDMYGKSGRAGAVFWGPRYNKSTRFGIYTRDRQGEATDCVFGEVVGGLEGVTAAAQHSSIKEVTVVDCGVVLWA